MKKQFETVQEIFQSYSRRSKREDNRNRKIQVEIAELKSKIDLLTDKMYKVGVTHRNSILEPIVSLLQKRYPDYDFDILGAFGLSCEYAIHAHPKGKTKEDKDYWEHVKSVNLRPEFGDNGDVAFGIVDYRNKVLDYPQGTIGELNGMNYGTVQLKNIEQIIDFFESKNKKA